MANVHLPQPSETKMTSIDTKPDPVATILKSRGLVLRALALVASVVGLALPGVTSTTMGMVQTASVAELGPWFILAPIAIAAALVMPGLAPRYGRLADIIATILIALVAVFAANGVFSAQNHLSQMGGMLGGNPGRQSYAHMLGIGISPGPGLFVTAGAAVLMVVQSVLPRKGTGALGRQEPM